MLRIKHDTSQRFELCLHIRDVNGNATGKQRCYSTDSAYKLFEFWQRNHGQFKKKKKRKKASRTDTLPGQKEADKILKESQEYADKQNKENSN